MKADAHLAQLSRRHAEIDTLIHEEQIRPGSDGIRLTELKRKKLRLKDEMERMQH